jgi:hypothetical protein
MTMRKIAMFLAVICAVAIGCATMETTAYRSIGSVAVTVDTAMQAWGDAVRAGVVTPDQEVAVKAGYLKYQSAMRTANAALTAYKLSAGQNKNGLNVALDTLDGCAADLTQLIRELTTKKAVTQ